MPAPLAVASLAFFYRFQSVPEPLPAAKHDGYHDDVQVVDQVSGQERADGGRAAADADIAASGGLTRLRERLGQDSGPGSLSHSARMCAIRPGMSRLELRYDMQTQPRPPGLRGTMNDAKSSHRPVAGSTSIPTD
jgi:hypothetical protein